MFESRDLTYQGPERRLAARRITEDRRQSIRFELESNDRRILPGRRSEDSAIDVWRNQR